MRAVRDPQRQTNSRAGMLGITIGVHPAVEWLASVTTPPALGRGIQVTPAFPHLAR